MPSQNHQVSNFALRVNLWFVRHKLLFYNGLIGILIFTNLLLYGYSMWGVIKLYTVEKDDYVRIIQSLLTANVDFGTWKSKHPFFDLQRTQPQVLNGTFGRKNIYVIVRNPNDQYVARSFTYRFLSGEEVIEEGESFVWPRQENFLTAFGVSEEVIRSGIQLVIEDVVWEYMPNFDEIKREKMNIQIFDIQVHPPVFSSEGIPDSGSVVFSVKNETLYNFWDVGFFILLKSGGDILDLYYTQIDSLRSFEQKTISFNLQRPLLEQVTPQVDLHLNILDEDVFFIEDLGSGELK